jgi:hypothetical protein
VNYYLRHASSATVHISNNSFEQDILIGTFKYVTGAHINNPAQFFLIHPIFKWQIRLASLFLRFRPPIKIRFRPALDPIVDLIVDQGARFFVSSSVSVTKHHKFRRSGSRRTIQHHERYSIVFTRRFLS